VSYGDQESYRDIWAGHRASLLPRGDHPRPALRLSQRRHRPLDCATGTLTLVRSTAFKPVLQEAAEAYKSTCPGATFTIETQSSGAGLRMLDGAGKANGSGSPNLLAFSDGAKSDGYPQLLPRPITFSLFTLVINKEAGVQDLSLEQISQLYTGSITNWTGWAGTTSRSASSAGTPTPAPGGPSSSTSSAASGSPEATPMTA
jgi:ABC-type phosphate transport system substrate-binding protein